MGDWGQKRQKVAKLQPGLQLNWVNQMMQNSDPEVAEIFFDWTWDTGSVDPEVVQAMKLVVTQPEHVEMFLVLP